MLLFGLLAVAICAEAKSSVYKKEIESKLGETVSINCSPPENITKVTWKVGKNDVSAGKKFSFSKVGEIENGILKIQTVSYGDRNNYLCIIDFPDVVDANVTTNASMTKDFRLRVRDPLGALWPSIGILAEALILFIVLSLTGCIQQRSKPQSLSSLRHGNSNDASYGSIDGQ